MVTYVILNTTEITDEKSVIDFSKLMNRNAAMLRYSVDGSKALVKYNGDQPSFLNGKTTYTHSEIKVEMAKSDWTIEE
tara:strand:+ start:5965 stop:6198 length:234 start_codon:yes stop_codon:yes gene_type:complete